VALGVPVVRIFAHLTPAGLALAGVVLALVLARMALALAQNRVLLSESRVEALVDPLTGLASRRQLKTDLARLGEDPSTGPGHAVVLFDLNGFKSYNDPFGHAAGDALLAQLGASLRRAVPGRGEAYRMGGDEFCVLAPCAAGAGEAFAAQCATAFVTRGDGFSIDAAYGVASLPSETADPTNAVALADARMYGNKSNRGRPAAAEELAVAGERSARLVRWSHERLDGHGYPDGLQSDDIPLGARIVDAVDAFVAMTSERPYRPTLDADGALAELHRNVGTDFDPVVVQTVETVLHAQAAQPA
jgi:diguanylate cyclase (GGDEF)-like protein